MGTNYYVISNKCEHCGRYDIFHHIGKNSWGWTFTFQAYRYDHLTSWKEWKEFLTVNKCVIYDEYGEEVHLEEFIEMVETYKAPNWVNPDNGHKNQSHYRYVKDDPKWKFDPDTNWEDDEGYSFINCDFS